MPKNVISGPYGKYHIFRTIRHTGRKMYLGFRGKIGERKPQNPAPPPHPTPPTPCEPAKLYSDYKTHPHFPPKWGSASYSLKNTAEVHSRVAKLFYTPTNNR